MIFLRALVAPLYLVACSVLGLAATLGLTTFFFQDLLGRDEITYYVPFAAAVLLVALGSDYNVFVAGRIWEEAAWTRVPEALAVATPSAAKAITVAGLALGGQLRAARDRSPRRLPGVRLRHGGRRPRRHLRRALAADPRTDRAGRRAGLVARAAGCEPSRRRPSRSGWPSAGIGRCRGPRASAATLTTLGERLDERERDELAAHLPEHLAELLARG